MNKKLFTIASVSLLLLLSACSPAVSDEDETPAPDNDVVETDDNDADDNEVEEEKTDLQLQEEFVRETFAKYNYEAPEYATWNVKEEGPDKMAVIIKENVDGQDKPNISKVIYLWDGSKETAEVLHVEVENQSVFSTDTEY